MVNVYHKEGCHIVGGSWDLCSVSTGEHVGSTQGARGEHVLAQAMLAAGVPGKTIQEARS